MKSLAALQIACAAALATGCAAPASVTGVFGGDDFALVCESPLARSDASGRDNVVVLSEAAAETLSTVNVRLKDIAALPLGKPVNVGDGEGDDEGQPSIQVVVGPLVVETRADGVEILSTRDPRRAISTAGSITVDEVRDDGLAGSFRADLDDGGYVEGFFDATMTY